jgi:hypothetical protein
MIDLATFVSAVMQAYRDGHAAGKHDADIAYSTGFDEGYARGFGDAAVSPSDIADAIMTPRVHDAPFIMERTVIDEDLHVAAALFDATMPIHPAFYEGDSGDEDQR